ncbi:MAG: hypothetical protein NVSMB23_13460 [Myxococcales bacterium]
MARVGRLAGALLAESEGSYFLVGDLKEPCDFRSAGFQAPERTPGPDLPFVRLQPLRDVSLAAPRLVLDVEGEELALLLFRRLVIARNGSVSSRLWRVVTGPHQQTEIDARWLGHLPLEVWDIVRESVLRCS